MRGCEDKTKIKIKKRKTDCCIRTERSVLRTLARKEKDTRWETMLAHFHIRNMLLEPMKNTSNLVRKGRPD